MSFDASAMQFFKAVYKNLLKPAFRIEIDEGDLERVLQEKTPRIEVSSKGVEFVAMIDPGSQLTLMKLSTFERLGRSLKPKTIGFAGLDGIVHQSLGTCLLPLRIDNMKVAQVFTIAEDNVLPEECILGADFLHLFRSFGFICNGRKIFADGAEVTTLK